MGGIIRLTARGAVAWIARAFVALALIGWAGTASAAMYIGAGLTEVKAEDRAVVAHPQPVQLLFVFQTKGAPNAAATKFVKQMVTDTVKASGAFSEVSDAPTSNGAILSVVINNVVAPKDMSDAEGKGVLVGATFFIAGTNVVDHYIGSVDFVGGPTSPKISKSAQQILITQIGLINSAPQNAVKVGGIKPALAALVNQIVGNPLNDVAKDPGFQMADNAGAAASTAAAAPTTAAAPPVTPTSAALTPTASPTMAPPAEEHH